MHLPIAGKSNVIFQKDLSGRDTLLPCCMEDETVIMDVKDAIAGINEVRKSLPNLSVIAIAGPKEPLADFETVKQALLYIKQMHPEMNLCMSTNGLLLPVYANHLISLGLNSISVTLYTLNPQTGARLFEKIIYLGHNYYGVEGANILIQNQIAGIHFMTLHGIAVRLTIPVIEGINEDELEEMVLFAKTSGCRSTNIIRANVAVNENGLETYYSDGYAKRREQFEKLIPQSYFCKPCKAETVETLNTILLQNFAKSDEVINSRNDAKHTGIRFAVCSKAGVLTDQHFGLSTRLYIYEYLEGSITFLEERKVHIRKEDMAATKKESKIYYLIRAVEDCNCVICVRMGSCPANALKEKKIDTYITYNLIEDGIKEAVHRLYQGRRFL